MNNSKSVVVLGKFDGVHVAHAKLITTAVDIAKKSGAISLVYSMQKTGSPVITDADNKTDIIKRLGADEVIFKELDDSFMNLSAQEFVESIIKAKLNACCVVVGENFRFGKNRSAGCNELSKLCFACGIDVVIIDTIQIAEKTVSSTFIKELLARGDVSSARQYMGRPYCLCGKVSEGKHLGRKLGFPTINLYPDSSEIILGRGVYATRVVCGERTYLSITNVGVNPTVEQGRNIKAETHIFGETDICYDDEIKVEFLEFIRSEMQFESVEELQKKVALDIVRAKEIHNI